MRVCIPVIAVLLSLSLQSMAQVIRVPEDHLKIQDAINRAENGDTVLISEGTYYENINFNGKAITVASHFLLDRDTAHISRTIIDGSKGIDPHKSSVVSFSSGEDTTSILCGLTLQGGKGSRIDSIHTHPDYLWPIYLAGGGILLYKSGGKVMHNIIQGNHLDADETYRGAEGGGIMAVVSGSHTAIIRHNIIRNNSGKGAVGHGGGAGLFCGRILFEHNAVIQNRILGKHISVGGGIFYEDDDLPGTIKHVIIRNNSISLNHAVTRDTFGWGGGIFLSMGSGEERIQVQNNLISNNYSNEYGGGIGAWESRANVENNIIANNEASVSRMNVALDEGGNDITADGNVVWKGDLWLATRSGARRITTNAPGYMRHLLPGDRVGRYDIPYFSLDPATGELLPGKAEHLLHFRPDSIPDFIFDPPSVIVDFRPIADSFHGLLTLREGREDPPTILLELPPKTKLLQFHLGPLVPQAQAQRQHMYYLAGVDPDTIFTLDQTTRYTQMKPGKYHFWTTWYNTDSTGDPHGMNIQLVIPPSWYQTTFAKFGYIFLLLLLFLGYVRFRTIRLRKEKIRLEKEVTQRTAELQLKNEQISEMEALKTRFFTDISHEIRTPLSMIKGPLETLLKQDHRDPRTDHWLEMISRYSEQLLQLVNQLLEISRLDSGYMKLVLEESDVCDAVRQMASEFTSMAERKGIRYIIDVPRDPAIYWFDRAKLEKIVVNLISNAIKFTPEMGKVTCRVKMLRSTNQDPKAKLRIIISDTGPGIPEDERDLIFERFYRSGSDLNRDAGGTGIGLSLVKELVSLMHGDVCVRNLSSQGSAFIVTIPMGKEHLGCEEFTLQTSRLQKSITAEKNPQGSLDTMHGEPAAGTQQVLVVEDNEDLRCFICENLSDQFSILEAADGNEGLRKAHLSIPDLIISDVMMPGMDGMELCRRVKSDERMSHIPVILLTAKSTTSDKILGLDVGADDYIYKPFSIDELHARIKNLLEQRELLRRKYSAMIGMDWGSLTVKTIDEQFLKKLTGIIGEHLQDFELNVGFLQEKMFMSREHLYRKVRALTGESPSGLIRLMRMKRAASMLENGEHNITRVAYNAGFANLSYFAKRFREYYGKSPREYRKSKKESQQDLT